MSTLKMMKGMQTDKIVEVVIQGVDVIGALLTMLHLTDKTQLIIAILMAVVTILLQNVTGGHRATGPTQHLLTGWVDQTLFAPR